MNKTELDESFIDACARNDLNAVKQLLNPGNILTKIKKFFNPDALIERADIHAREDSGFYRACMYGYLDIVRYLLVSPELTEHTDIHADDNWGYCMACHSGHLDVVKYLLTSPELVGHNYITDYDEFTSIKDFTKKFGQEFTIEILNNFPPASCKRLMSSPSERNEVVEFFMTKGIEMPGNLKTYDIQQEIQQEIELHL